MLSLTKRMQSYISAALKDDFTREAVFADFSHTFGYMGMPEKEAQNLTSHIMALLEDIEELNIAEISIYTMLNAAPCSAKNPIPVTDVIDHMLTGRAEKIFEQTYQHLSDIKGKIIDFGAGDGQVTQLMANSGLDIQGIDVRAYKAPNITVKIDQFDGGRTKFAHQFFKAALVTNVLHHEINNEKCLSELSRIVSDRLVVVETVPVGATPDDIEKDRLRSFMNDYFYNRLLHDPKFDVPVPGTYETPEGWIKRFEKHGWNAIHSENLGIDQPVIQDTHHLLIFER
ncbi:MAG: methyltransferase domain-containing protein [Alphaproteobacteria bacterium]|nr:methyltransferase domain-containing protein [Alphaproteobacteria bacterium]